MTSGYLISYWWTQLAISSFFHSYKKHNKNSRNDKKKFTIKDLGITETACSLSINLKWQRSYFEMVFKIHYDWDVDFCKGSSNYQDNVFRIYSPKFIGSPGEVVHYWTVCLSSNPCIPDKYGVWVNLVDCSFKPPISMRFKYKMMDDSNQLLSEGSNGTYKFQRSNLGIGQYVDTCLVGELKNVKQISFDIELDVCSKTNGCHCNTRCACYMMDGRSDIREEDWR